MGDIEEMLQKLDAFCFTNQHVDCLYTFCNHRFSRKIVAKTGQMFDNEERAVYFNQRTKGVDRIPSIVKEVLEEKVPKAFTELFRKNKINAN